MTLIAAGPRMTMNSTGRKNRIIGTVSLGGSVLVPPHVDRHGGKLAVIADPSGAPFGVMEWNDADALGEAK